ncbi:carotenoid 1,2-hydratase [Acidisphaera rubrifaciens]|uniref:Hydroxyneurosporene dehydrogenase n=1 Tax=Acidisphaera rubrifaciens HS-AP3 TaxID=1231350 RepID=A0A0D6P7Q8_9PROT|nr:carotenoid 1,2-hydratase [Acidisphaera rubrifaciens]GAN77692.1 hydroxyneurosporene dehydrogenase [Acidisphaera rubrifaciens HS-AP3]
MNPRDFSAPVPAGGYAWWYVDAVSDDGRSGLTVIAFVGSVFSPYYSFARRRGPVDPERHCAVNVVLYGERGRRWTMTERGASHLHRTATSFALGPSTLAWDGDALVIDIDERAAPLPRRVRGRVRVHPGTPTDATFHLDAERRHRWSPIAPCARVEVRFDQPALAWAGDGYFDSNAGSVPLEDSFDHWTWSRAPLRDGAAILYDVRRRDGSVQNLSLRVGRDGRVADYAAPAACPLPGTRWGIARATRAETPGGTRLRTTLTDAPFYARSLLDTRIDGEPVIAMHEALSMRRFVAPWVQAMLPFRMPRALR